MGFRTKVKLTPPVLLALAAGVLLFVSGTTGAATWENLGQLARDNIADNKAVELTFRVLVFLGSLGGLLVITGGLLIGMEKIDRGRLLITVGVGTGLIGVILLFWSWYEERPEVVTVGFLMGLAGIVLSVMARSWAKAVKKD